MYRLLSFFMRLLLKLAGANIGEKVCFKWHLQLPLPRNLQIGARSYLGNRVTIQAESFAMGIDCYISDDVTIIGRHIRIGDNCVLFPGVTIHGIKDVTIGDYCKISRHASVKCGGNIEIGCEFWMNKGAEIGGGGWRNPQSGLTIGDRCHIGRNSHLNVAEAIAMGDDTAIGMDCTLATHAHWQPITLGYEVTKGPITLGKDVAIYSRCVITPGVHIADGATVAAGAVVNKNVPSHRLVGGVPARDIKASNIRPDNPQKIITDLLTTFIHSQYPNSAYEWGQESFHCHILPSGQGIYFITGANHQVTIREEAAILLSYGTCKLPLEVNSCHFDLQLRTLSGQASDLSEQLRNFFFRYGIRFKYLSGYQRHPLSIRYLKDLGIE